MMGWTLITLGTLLLGLVLWRFFAPHHKVRWAAHARCPKTLRIATLTVLEDIHDHRAIDVRRCSELREPTTVDCDKRCLDDINLIRRQHLATDVPLR